MNFEAHIEMLARRHEIAVVRVEGIGGRADVDSRTVWIEEDLDDEFNYLVALHKIGHIVAEVWATDLEREWAAWNWALAEIRHDHNA